MKPIAFAAVVVALCLASVSAEGQTTKKKPAKAPRGGQNQQATIDLYGMEVGQEGYLTFGEGKGKNTLYPLKTGDIAEGQFIGMAGEKPKVIVRGVKTDGVVSGRYFQLNGVVKVTGTEKVSTGETVFVLEPTDPKSFALQRSDQPSLVIPR